MEDQASSPASTSSPEVLSYHCSITAQNKGVAIAPQVINSNIKGPLNITVMCSAANDHQIASTSDGAAGIKTEIPFREKELESVRQVQQKLKLGLKTKLKYILGDIAENNIVHCLIQPLHYFSAVEETEREHEIWTIEKASLKQMSQHKMDSNDIFKPSSGTNKPPRTVLTKGISGIGKTFSVQKFIFDWAEGKANQDVDFMFLLPFWELDMMKDGEYDLHGLLCQFYPELKDLNLQVYEKCKVVIIFDGLDENRDFFKSKKRFNVAKKSSVGLLISDLISGVLLPSAHIWITSRPAAANRIPAQPDRVTEILGFSHLQIDEYFSKKISDQNQANKIILHIKSSRQLYVMCHVPFFCYITATVLQKFISNSVSRELPKTLTEIYTCFVLNKAEDIETKPVKLSDLDVKTVVELGKLAFDYLRDNAVITEEMLSRYGIVISKEAKHSQVLMFILREENPVIPDHKIYRFLHSGVQEFLAALYVLNSYTYWHVPKFQPVPCMGTSADPQCKEEFEVTPQQQSTLHDMLRVVVDRALESHDGHLDFFLRFLLGLSLNCTRNSMPELIGATEDSLKNIQKTISYIKYIINNKDKVITHPRCIHLLRCLAELKDCSLEEDIRNLLSSSNNAEAQLSIAQCSVLAELVQISGTAQDELDVRKLCPFFAGQERLVSVLRYFKKVSLVKCWGSQTVLNALLLALVSPDSQLRELDLSHSGISSAQFTPLCWAMRNSRLQSLNLSHVNLAIIPQSEPKDEYTWLEFLFGDTQSICDDLLHSFTNTTTGMRIETCGTRILQAILFGPHVQLHSLNLRNCNLSDYSCEVLASALQSTNSVLKELDLSYNNLTDIQSICDGLRHHNCVLEILRLNGLSITVDSCKALGAVLPRSRLKELQLGPSRIGDDGLKLFSAALRTNSILHILGLSHCNLTGGSCEALAAAFSSDCSALRELDLTNNDLEDSGVRLFSAGLKSPHCKLEILRLSGCMIAEEGCSSLASALKSNPSHLRELDLSYNHPGKSGEKLLSDVKAHCKLEILNLDKGGKQRMKPGVRKYACDLGNFKMTHNCDIDTWKRFLDDQGFSGLSESRFYWQVEWTGVVCIGMKYKDSYHSWYLYCSRDNYTAGSLWICGENNLQPKQLGVYLDWPAGMLSFYEVASDQIMCVHRVHHRFEEPLFPHLTICKESSIKICSD